jgi:hypothetical protein
MMKPRGLFLTLAALPLWSYVFRFWSVASRSPFGHELGSVAFPIPPLVRTAIVLATVFMLVGFSLLVFDLIQWTRRRSHDSPR